MFTQTPQKRIVNSVVTQHQKEKKSEGGRMYAIAFDMDIESLKLNYGDPYKYRDWETDRKSTRLNSSHRL